MPLKKFPHPIYNNCLPHIDIFNDDGYTKEEQKMINEARKILHNPNLKITATCVRVPVLNCHCESINLEFEQQFDIKDVYTTLENFENICVMDNPKENIYPIPTNISGKDNVFVGRIRRDFSVENGLNMWVVADNVRKGAATNAIQILEKLIK
jgi:aspartate-semialdehyde dehydrogenase